VASAICTTRWYAASQIENSGEMEAAVSIFERLPLVLYLHFVQDVFNRMFFARLNVRANKSM